MSELQDLDCVALLEDVPAKHFGTGAAIKVLRGAVGTVVDVPKDRRAFLVEFAEENGEAYAIIALQPEQLLRLRHVPASEAAASMAPAV
jgi:hypothetical protein